MKIALILVVLVLFALEGATQHRLVNPPLDQANGGDLEESSDKDVAPVCDPGCGWSAFLEDCDCFSAEVFNLFPDTQDVPNLEAVDTTPPKRSPWNIEAEAEAMHPIFEAYERFRLLHSHPMAAAHLTELLENTPHLQEQELTSTSDIAPGPSPSGESPENWRRSAESGEGKWNIYSIEQYPFYPAVPEDWLDRQECRCDCHEKSDEMDNTSK